MTQRARLTYRQIAAVLSLHKRGGSARPITLEIKLRDVVPPLWRRDIIEVWYRCAPEIGSQGPYFGFTTSGAMLAQSIYDRRRSNAAPRANSGAEDDQ